MPLKEVYLYTAQINGINLHPYLKVSFVSPRVLLFIKIYVSKLDIHF